MFICREVCNYITAKMNWLNIEFNLINLMNLLLLQFSNILFIVLGQYSR